MFYSMCPKVPKLKNTCSEFSTNSNNMDVKKSFYGFTINRSIFVVSMAESGVPSSGENFSKHFLNLTIYLFLVRRLKIANSEKLH